MISVGSRFLEKWKSGVFRLGSLVEMFVPTEIVSAGASSEYSTNFPAAAMNDGDRTILNAGPFDREENGYGPADNLIGKGLWMGKHPTHDPVFTIDNANAWRGEAWKSSVYYQEVSALNNPITGLGTLLAYYPLSETHVDVTPIDSTNNPDVCDDESPTNNDGPYQMIFATAGPVQYNNDLGRPGIIVGDDRSAAGMESLHYAHPWTGGPFGSMTLGIHPQRAIVGEQPTWNPTPTRTYYTFNVWIRFSGTSGLPRYIFEKTKLEKELYGTVFAGLTITCDDTRVYLKYDPHETWGPRVLLTAEGLTLNDGQLHMITVMTGKEDAGLCVWEIYADGELEARITTDWPWGDYFFPPGSFAYIGGGHGYGNNPIDGEMQHFTIHDFPWFGDESPDYAPGLVQYNQVKYVWGLGKDGVDHPASPVPPVFTGTTIVGDLLEPDFAGGTKHVDAFDEAFEGEKYELFDPGWTKIPVGDWSKSLWREKGQLALAQSSVLPPGAGGKCLKVFSKPAVFMQSYGMNSPWINNPGFFFTHAGYWENDLDGPAASGKLVFDAMIHEQGTNPGQGHLMVECWEGTPRNGRGFKVIFSEATHNFHISTNANPTVNHDYYQHIYAGDGTDTGVPWAYDTWYNISVTFNVVAGQIKLAVNGTVIATLTDLLLTTGIDKVRIWYKADDRLPPEAFPPAGNPAFDAQYATYGMIHYYINDLRVGSGCYLDFSTYELVVELGGFAIGNGEFAFEAENVTITDGASVYTPYWSFELAYGSSATGPWSALDPVYPNAGKNYQASGVVFDPQGASYVKVVATYHADGAGCLGSAGLKKVELEFGDLAQGIVFQTNGADVGRIILNTDPYLGGIQAFTIQHSDTGTNYRTIPGSDILRVRSYEKDNGRSLSEWYPDGGIAVSPQTPWAPTSIPSVIIVDLKRNFSAESTPAVYYIRILISEAGTLDDLARCSEVELFGRYDVTKLTESYDVAHQADVNFETITARTGTFELKNPRKTDGTFTFTKAMFRRQESGQLSIDASVEIAVWQEIEGEWNQLAWLSVDDPGINHESGMLSLQSRGRHEKLLLTKFPATFRSSIRYDHIVQLIMELSNIPLAFYAMRQNTGTIPFGPTRSAWEELTDIKQAMEDPGIFFDGESLMRNVLPAVPAVLDTIVREGPFHRFVEHVSGEIAGRPSALHAVEVSVNRIITLTDQLLFTELPETAGVAERIIALESPADPTTIWNNWTELKITRAHARFPKIAETVQGAVIRGSILKTESTEELILGPWTTMDDPNQIIKDKISNPYIVTVAQAQSIANARLEQQKYLMNWAEVEWPSSPHVELGDIYQVTMVRRAVDQVYAVKVINHTMRTEEGGATCRSSLELVEKELP